MDAGRKYEINEEYLISHALLEMGSEIHHLLEMLKLKQTNMKIQF